MENSPAGELLLFLHLNYWSLKWFEFLTLDSIVGIPYYGIQSWEIAVEIKKKSLNPFWIEIYVLTQHKKGSQVLRNWSEGFPH